MGSTCPAAGGGGAAGSDVAAPRPVPADLDLLERLELVERAQQHIQMALSKNDGALVAMGQQVQGLVHSLSQNQATAADSLRQLVDSHMVRQLGEARQSRVELQQQFTALQQALAQQLQRLNQDNHQTAEQLRGTLNERLASIQSDNAAKLEEMRRTVDENSTPRWSSAWANLSSWSATGSSRCTRGWARCSRWPAAWAT